MKEHAQIKEMKQLGYNPNTRTVIAGARKTVSEMKAGLKPVVDNPNDKQNEIWMNEL